MPAAVPLRQDTAAARVRSSIKSAEHGGAYVFERKSRDERLVVAVNLTAKPQKVPVQGKALFSSLNRPRVCGALAPYEAAVLAEEKEEERT